MYNNSVEAWKTVSAADGYLALRKGTTYDASNEIGKLFNGDTVKIQQGTEGSYVWYTARNTMHPDGSMQVS